MATVGVLLRVSDQFLAFLMSGQVRCGHESPAHPLCRNPSLARQLWDITTTTPRRYAVVSTLRTFDFGECSHVLAFGVSPLTSGVIGDVTSKFHVEWEKHMLDENHYLDKDHCRVMNLVTGGVTKLGRRVIQCDVNDRWLVSTDYYSGQDPLLSVSNMREMPTRSVIMRFSSAFKTWCISLNHSNAEQLLSVQSSKASKSLSVGGNQVSFLIQVINLPLTFETKAPVIVSSTNLTIPVSNGLCAHLCMRRKNGINVFILSFSGEVLMVEETTGAFTPLCLHQDHGPFVYLLQQDCSIFLVSSTIVKHERVQVSVEFWDCNKVDKPLRVVQQNDGIYQWKAESGFFFKHFNLAGWKKGVIIRTTVEEATTGTVVISLQFAPGSTKVLFKSLHSTSLS